MVATGGLPGLQDPGRAMSGCESGPWQVIYSRTWHMERGCRWSWLTRGVIGTQQTLSSPPERDWIEPSLMPWPLASWGMMTVCVHRPLRSIPQDLKSAHYPPGVWGLSSGHCRMWPWANPLTSLNLSVHSCEMAEWACPPCWTEVRSKEYDGSTL